MDLANYKKVWKNQPEEKNKISALEIYKKIGRAHV